MNRCLRGVACIALAGALAAVAARSATGNATAAGAGPTFSVRRLAPDIPYAGAIGAIALDPNGAREAYVAAANGGVFHSIGLTRWTHVDALAGDRVNALAFVSNGGVRRVLATTSQGYEAHGAGGVWVLDPPTGRWTRAAGVFPAADRTCPATAGAWDLSIAADTRRAYVATDCGIAVGSPDASTWRALAVNGGTPPFRSIAVLPGGNAIVGGPAGVWSTHDGGATWQTEATGIGSISSVRGLSADPRGGARAFAVNDAKALYATRDGGRSWTRIAADPGSFSCGGTAFAKAVLDRGAVDVYFGNRCDTARTRFAAAADAPGDPHAWTTLAVGHADTRDIAFASDGVTPLLMSSDGGLHVSANGERWESAGNPAAGLDALAVTEVRGQYSGRATSPDLYFATQDNALWALRAHAPAGEVRWEGFYMNLAPRVASDRDAVVTYASCGGCGNNIAGALFRDAKPWRNVRPGARAPVPVSPGTYVQQADAFDGDAGSLQLTADGGVTWRTVAPIAQPMHDEPKVAGNGGAPILYQAIQTGTRADGRQIVGLVRVSNVLGSVAVKNYPRMQGFGSLGVMPTAFAWYEVYAVDPNDPARIIAPDVFAGDVKASADGGDTWVALAQLSALIARDASYVAGIDATDRIAPLLSAVSFCPQDSHRVLAGTHAGGAYASFDGGARWRAIAGSQALSNATSIFWLEGCRKAWVSTYGRGIWEIGIDAAATARTPIPRGTLGPGGPPPEAAAQMTIVSGVLEEGERVLDPGEPLVVQLQPVGLTAPLELAIDALPAASVERGRQRYTLAPGTMPWPLGHHALSLVAIENGVRRTLATTEFIVP